jgi:hypothetical protein
MKIRTIAALAAALLLSACSDQDWDHALSYTGMGGAHDEAAAEPAATTAQPTPMTAQAAPASAQVAASGTTAQPNAFCESVASQDAGGNDFDPATQKRVFIQSYQQCVAIFGGATK